MGVLINLARCCRNEGDWAGALRAYLWARRRSRADLFTLGPLVTIVGLADAAYLEGVEQEELARRTLTMGSTPTRSAGSRRRSLLRAAGGGLLLVVGVLSVFGGGDEPSGSGIPSAAQEVLELAHPDQPGLYLERAREAVSGQDYGLALSICEAFERRFATDARLDVALMGKAQSLQLLGRDTEAHRTLGRLADTLPASPLVSRAHLTRAELYLAGGTRSGLWTSSSA